MRVALLIILSTFSIGALSQEKVTFYTEDSLKVTADLYLVDYMKPFILLFHQVESSRGEYKDIAPKLNKLGYNCLAVDLRAGEKSNYIKNETAFLAHQLKISNRFIDAQRDMTAAMDYVLRFNEKPVLLFGSSYSASLSLMQASRNERISAVIAFSPGEYFRPEVVVKDEISGLNIPVFIAASEIEYSYVNDITSVITSDHKMIFKPSQSRGIHGAKSLWETSEGSSEYWLILTQFFRKLQEI